MPCFVFCVLVVVFLLFLLSGYVFPAFSAEMQRMTACRRLAHPVNTGMFACSAAVLCVL